jgi:outer membrane protein assembly factor BamB
MHDEGEMTESAQPRRGRRYLLLVGLLAVLGVGTFALYRSGWLRRMLADDTVNPAELERLGGKPLESAPTAAPTTGWPQWRGPHRDGRAAAGPFRTDWDNNPPKVLWSSPCGGGFSSLAVVGGRVYTQDRQDGGERVFCLDAESGKLLWEHRYAADYSVMDQGYAAGPRATPTVEGNRVYAVGAVGKFVCLEPHPGGPPRVVWERDLKAEFPGSVPQWGVACSPLIEGDLVIVQPGGRNGAVVAFDKATGEPRWTAGTNPPGYSSPVAATVGGVRVVYAFTGDALLCVRAADGTVLDSFSWPTRFSGNIATPVVVDDYVFISSAYSMGCALLRVVPHGDRVRLERVYDLRRRPPMLSHHGTVVYRDGFVYGFSGEEGRFKCVNLRTGKAKDDWEVERLDKGSVILADRHLIVLTQSGTLALVEATPEEFREVGRVPKALNGRNNWALPVLADGRLFLRDDENVLCLTTATN